MTQLELNQFEYNTMLKAIEDKLYESLERAKTEKTLTKRAKESGIITWKQSAKQTEELLEKLRKFTFELNHHFDVDTNTGRAVYLIQK